MFCLRLKEIIRIEDLCTICGLANLWAKFFQNILLLFSSAEFRERITKLLISATFRSTENNASDHILLVSRRTLYWTECLLTTRTPPFVVLWKEIIFSENFSPDEGYILPLSCKVDTKTTDLLLLARRRQAQYFLENQRK